MSRLVVRCVALLVPVLAFIVWRNPSPAFTRLDERASTAMYDAEIGWVPRPGFHGPYTGSVTFTVAQNSLGLREHELGTKSKPRLAVIGDSHVWGYDAEQGARFTDELARRRPDIEVINAGVSGYGTDQEFLFLRRLFAALQPDAVIVVFAEVDHEDNASDQRWGYFKPYFALTGAGITLAGTPVPRSVGFYAAKVPWLFRAPAVAHLFAAVAEEFRPPPKVVPVPTVAIFREMQRFLSERHVALGVAFEADDPALTDSVRAMGIPTARAKAPVGAGLHWTPEGHLQVAAQLEPLVRALLP